MSNKYYMTKKELEKILDTWVTIENEEGMTYLNIPLGALYFMLSFIRDRVEIFPNVFMKIVMKK